MDKITEVLPTNLVGKCLYTHYSVLTVQILTKDVQVLILCVSLLLLYLSAFLELGG